jgi:hypothetical protein
MTKLKNYFPMIRERREILEEIRRKPKLSQKFDDWTKKQQEEFLDCCTGVKGMKLLYDAFFKEIMNPEIVPERLNEFLSLLLGMEVEIVKVLPTDSSRLADESSLLIMDILVQMKDGTLANVEVQKLGYHFPGQRSACYSAYLLLRQYKRIRGEQTEENTKKKFNYRSIKTVYTIVLFEQSEKIFHQFPDTYLHYFEQCSNTGLKLELDRGTVQYMIDEMQDEIDKQKKVIEQKELELEQQARRQKEELEQKDAENRKYKEELEELQRQLRQLKKEQ